KKRARVARILFRNPFRNILGAFELRASVEIHALLAGVQLQLALGALPEDVESRREHRTAVRAARPDDGANHTWSSRPHLLLPRARLWRPIRAVAFFFRAIPTLLIALLLILP